MANRSAASWTTQRARRWGERNTLAVGDLPSIEEMVARKRAGGLSISVGIPALDEEATIGAICSTIVGDLVERNPLVDEVLVLDGGSTDATVARARAAGADVTDMRAVLPSVPYLGGKGESLWRSLTVLGGDIVCWVDADIRDFDQRFVSHLVGPLLLDEHLSFVKGFYRRPLEIDGVRRSTGGGRVTELLARPLLGAFFPELAGFRQPLAGEYAGRREALERVPFFTGYSVEAGLLIDLLDLVGLDALAQSDLIERVHRNRPLADLTSMAHTIGRTILRRADEHGRINLLGDPASSLLVFDGDGVAERHVEEVQRPPIATLDARAPAFG